MKKIKYYEIGYSSPEDSCYVTLTHTEKFTNKDIENLLVEYLRLSKKYPRKHSNDNSFGMILSNFILYLCRKKGFKELKYTDLYSLFGWPDVFDKNSWIGQRGNSLDSLTNKLLKYKKFQKKKRNKK